MEKKYEVKKQDKFDDMTEIISELLELYNYKFDGKKEDLRNKTIDFFETLDDKYDLELANTPPVVSFANIIGISVLAIARLGYDPTCVLNRQLELTEKGESLNDLKLFDECLTKTKNNKEEK